MTAQMVDSEQRHAPFEGQRLRRRQPDGEAAGQPRPMRDGHDGEAAPLGALPQPPEQRREVAQMFACREVGDHAAVALVQGNLTVHQLQSEATRRVKHRQRGLVARAFEGKDHEPSMSSRVRFC